MLPSIKTAPCEQGAPGGKTKAVRGKPPFLGRRAAAASLLAWLIAAPFQAACAQTLAFPEALGRALGSSPTVPAAEARIAAAEAGVRQADVRLNPSVGIDVEDVAGTGPYSLIDRSKTTVYYEQRLERGGKREARVGAARAEVRIAQLRREVASLDLARDVELAWVEALAAQAQVAVVQDRLAAAQRLRTEVDRRVAAARDPLFAGARSDTEVAQAEIALGQARIAAENTRRALAAFWGGGGDFSLPSGALEDMSAVPTAPEASMSADVALLEAQREAAGARIRLQQSQSITDPTVRAGARAFFEDRALAFVVGGSIPLQRYDSKRGAVERARAERLAAEADITAAAAVRDREVARLRARMSANVAEVRRIDAEVVPPAERTISLVRDGFARGGGAFTYLDIIEAQRVLIDARGRRVEVLRAFHTDRAALNRLLGRYPGLEPIQESR